MFWRSVFDTEDKVRDFLQREQIENYLKYFHFENWQKVELDRETSRSKKIE